MRSLAILGLALSGCGWGVLAPAPERDNSPLQTESLVYNLRGYFGAYEADATVVYVNRTASPVFYAPCTGGSPLPDLDIVRAGNDTTPHVIGAGCAGVGLMATRSVAPGDSLVFSVFLGSGQRPVVDMTHRTGLFRILMHLCTQYDVESDNCILLPVEQRRSNVFRVAPPS